MTNLDIVKDWYQRIWIDEDLAAIESYFAPGAGADGILEDGQIGPQEFRAIVPAFKALVRGLTIEISHAVECDDWVWTRIIARGFVAQNLTPVEAQGQVMLRFKDGKIVQAFNIFDFMTLFSQGGLLPRDAFLLLLSGEKLG